MAGTWSNERKDVKLPITELNIEVEFIDRVLGTAPNDKDIYATYIGKNAPDADSLTEEIETLGEDEVVERGTTVFHRFKYLVGENGEMVDPSEVGGRNMVGAEILTPGLYDYQIKGAFKDNCSMLSKATGKDENGKKLESTESSKIKAFKKVIDGNIFIKQRRIPLFAPETYFNDRGEEVHTYPYEDKTRLGTLQRPLRAQTPQGERVSLASSEMLPAGTRFFITIQVMNPSYLPAVREWLDYWMIRGLCQWRNGGNGRCRWREVAPEDMPYAKLDLN